MAKKVDAIKFGIFFIIILLVGGIITFLTMSVLTVKKVKSSITNKNVKAFLKTIRIGEGTSGDNGYKTLFGSGTFSSYANHPNIRVTSGGYTSTAAGAYQILYKTWLECQSALSLSDFSPGNQDLAAVYLIERRGALDDVINGHFDQAVLKCNKEWASLPGSPYGQPTVSLETIRQRYKDYGGSLA